MCTPNGGYLEIENKPGEQRSERRVIQAKEKKQHTQQCKGPEVTVPCFRISRGQDAGVRKKKVKDEVGKESDLRLSKRGNSPNLYCKDIILVGHILLTIETEW